MIAYGSLYKQNWGYATGQLRVKVSVRCETEKSPALARFLLICASSLIHSACDGTHSGRKVVMDEHSLNGDESTKLHRFSFLD